MLRLSKHYLLALTIVVVCAAVILTSQLTGQQPAAGPYTAAQAAAGRTVYQASCSGCHGPDLGGLNDAAQLAGMMFIGEWGDRTPKDLIAFMQGAMPPCSAGS